MKNKILNSLKIVGICLLLLCLLTIILVDDSVFSQRRNSYDMPGHLYGRKEHRI